MSVWLMAWLVGSQNLRYFLLSTTSDFHLSTQRHSHIPIYGLIDTLKQRNSFIKHFFAFSFKRQFRAISPPKPILNPKPTC